MCRRQYKKVLVDEYKLRRLPKKRGVSRVDDLYHILFYHWVHDEVVYRDEQQRNYVSTGILMASYFGCRPVSMFDTRLRFEDDDGARKSVDHVTAAGKPNNVGEDQEVQGSENDMDANDDASTYCDSDSDSGTDHGVDAGLDETGCLLWRHITFIIAPNRIPGEPNNLVAKVTIIHTKGEDNRPRE